MGDGRAWGRRLAATSWCLLAVLAGVACGGQGAGDGSAEERFDRLGPTQVGRGPLTEAVETAGGLRWTVRSSDPEADELAGVMVAGDPVRRHVRVGEGRGEIIDVGRTICHLGLYTESQLPLEWGAMPRGKPWNCLRADDKLWAAVAPRAGHLADPVSYLRGLDTGRDWERPRLETVDGEPLMRYAFDSHEVWLDADSLPCRIEWTQDDGLVETWLVEAEPEAEVGLPPADQQTHVSPGFGHGRVGSCCLPMG